MSGAARTDSAKRVQGTKQTERRAIALIADRVAQMGHLWNETQNDYGIDGSIELVDPASNKATNRVVLVQSKGTSIPFGERVTYTPPRERPAVLAERERSRRAGAIASGEWRGVLGVATGHRRVEPCPTVVFDDLDGLPRQRPPLRRPGQPDTLGRLSAGAARASPGVRVSEANERVAAEVGDEEADVLGRRRESPARLLRPTRLLGCGVALIAEFCLPTKQRKALRSGHLARDLVADSLELLEHSGLSERSWSHA